jgi:hypothetical protein
LKQEVVDEYIDDLQNTDGWNSNSERSRVYWIEHYDDFRLDRAHRYEDAGLPLAPIRRLMLGEATIASSGGGFSNTARMVCSAIRGYDY